jgi:hypothetical protein
MKKPSCRRTGPEREQHERAIRVRKMTDAQLCEYLDNLAAGNRPRGPPGKRPSPSSWRSWASGGMTDSA